MQNIVESDGPQMTIWCMRVACWIPKATYTHSEYLKYILLFYSKMVTRTLLNVTLYLCCLTTKICNAAPNIGGYLVWNLFRVTLLALRILRLVLDFLETLCTPSWNLIALFFFCLDVELKCVNLTDSLDCG